MKGTRRWLRQSEMEFEMAPVKGSHGGGLRNKFLRSLFPDVPSPISASEIPTPGAEYRGELQGPDGPGRPFRRLQRTAEGFTKLEAGPLAETVLEDPRGVEPLSLAHGLERVLFERGVHPRRKKDGREAFDGTLAKIPRTNERFLRNVGEFVPTSRDQRLHALADEKGAVLKGSTSSISPLLSHMYWGLSNFRRVDLSNLSEYYHSQTWAFTPLSMRPSAVLLHPQDGLYSVDSDKGNRVAQNRVLLDLGKVMESWLTMPPDFFHAFYEHDGVPGHVDAYRYLSIGECVIRSQLDAQCRAMENSPEFGGSPFFELKTRATAPIRLDMENYLERRSYRIDRLRGPWWSYEREYYDMSRSTLLRYLFQMRVGHMSGMFVAYHNTDEVFGFEFLRRQELERVMFGSSTYAERMFHGANRLLQLAARTAIEHFGRGTTVRLTCRASRQRNIIDIFAERYVPQGSATSGTSEAAGPSADVQWWRLHLIKYENGHLADNELRFHPNEQLDIFFKLIDMNTIVGLDAVRQSYSHCQRQTLLYE